MPTKVRYSASRRSSPCSTSPHNSHACRVSQDPWFWARIDDRVGLRGVDRVVGGEEVRVAFWGRHQHGPREIWLRQLRTPGTRVLHHFSIRHDQSSPCPPRRAPPYEIKRNTHAGSGESPFIRHSPRSTGLLGCRDFPAVAGIQWRSGDRRGASHKMMGANEHHLWQPYLLTPERLEVPELGL